MVEINKLKEELKLEKDRYNIMHFHAQKMTTEPDEFKYKLLWVIDGLNHIIGDEDSSQAAYMISEIEKFLETK